MAERGTCFNLLILLLLLCLSASNLNAIPVTRIPISDHPLHNFRGFRQISQDIKMGSVKSFKRGRMNVELNDYPGSGANNRHSPKPQIIGRACNNIDEC